MVGHWVISQSLLAVHRKMDHTGAYALNHTGNASRYEIDYLISLDYIQILNSMMIIFALSCPERIFLPDWVNILFALISIFMLNLFP